MRGKNERERNLYRTLQVRAEQETLEHIKPNLFPLSNLYPHRAKTEYFYFGGRVGISRKLGYHPPLDLLWSALKLS